MTFSRVLGCVGLLAAGGVFGMLGTVLHRATIGTAALPVGIVVALLALGCLLAGIRLLDARRFSTVCAALGAIVVIAVLSQESFGGSVLIMGDAIGWIWIGGAIVVSLFAVGWPRHRAVN